LVAAEVTRLTSFKAERALGEKEVSLVTSAATRAFERYGTSGQAFTLIELVISSALMAMILAAAYVCLRAGLASQDLVDAHQEVFQSARVAMALLTADLRGACVLSKKFEFVGMHRMLGDTRSDNVDFATHNYTPRHPRESDWCEVSYFLDKESQSGKLSLWRRRDPTPDDDPFSGGVKEEIAQGLRGLKLEYYDGFDWYEEWGDAEGNGKAATSLKEKTNLSGLPDAVRITLWFDPNPNRRPEQGGTKDGTNEPPLVFQTVARLNLAPAVANSSTSSGSQSTNAAPASPSPSAGGPPGGPQ
jgi:type II secretion system protein J